MTPPKVKVFIPARSGSKRLPDKNLAPFGETTLLENAIAIGHAAFGVGSVFVSTDSERYAAVARNAGALLPSLRPSEFAQDASLDIEWLSHAISNWGIEDTYVSILRPTSPFVDPVSLTSAAQILDSNPDFHSIRSIRRASEHPGKMWRQVGDQIIPLLPQIQGVTPTHSRPTQSLESVFVQCGAFEIAVRQAVLDQYSISGTKILGYELSSEEGLDINSAMDYQLALEILRSRKAD